MSVVKARNGKGYEARWREQGKNKSATFRKKREAEEAERLGRDRERGRRHGLPFEQGPIVYAELCDRYLAQHQVRDRTLRTLRERLVSSRATFGGQRVREILSEEIGRWNAALPVGPTTRGHALRAMRQVLAAGVKWDYLARNPAGADVVPIPSPTRTEIRPFESWTDVYAVAEAAGPYAALVIFACATGLRPQEWQALEWRDVNLRDGHCDVRRTLQDDGSVTPTTKTDGSLRAVVLQRRAVDALASLPRPIDSTQRIWSGPEGGIVNLSNFRRRVWAPALAAAGAEHRRIYEMRHTYATLALAAGVPIEWISKQMGHTNIQTTLKHYARFLPATDTRALAALDAFESEEACVQIAYTPSVNGSDRA
ncbi:MAG: site-specific integrase [Gaiellaceae bacterium]